MQTHKAGCGCGSHGSMRDVIKGIYEMKGENYLSPSNKTMANGFWSAGQPNSKGGKK